MVKIETKTNKSKDSQALSFEYPASEKITIDKTNLHFQLTKFKEAVIDSFNFDSLVAFLITLSAVWVPIFTSDFKPLFGYGSSTIKGGYFGFVIFMTLYSLYRFILKPIGFHYFSKVEASQNPEKMAQIILDKCNKK